MMAGDTNYILLGDLDAAAGGAEDQVAGEVVLVGEVVGDPGGQPRAGEHRNAGAAAWRPQRMSC